MLSACDEFASSRFIAMIVKRPLRLLYGENAIQFILVVFALRYSDSVRISIGLFYLWTVLCLIA